MKRKQFLLFQPLAYLKGVEGQHPGPESQPVSARHHSNPLQPAERSPAKKEIASAYIRMHAHHIARHLKRVCKDPLLMLKAHAASQPSRFFVTRPASCEWSAHVRTPAESLPQPTRFLGRIFTIVKDTEVPEASVVGLASETKMLEQQCRKKPGLCRVDSSAPRPQMLCALTVSATQRME